MRRTSFRNAYRGLLPEELYRLAVAADARGDDAEREALVSSCPRVVVKTIHPAFEAALEGTWAMLDVAVPTLARYLGWLEALKVIHAPIQEAVAALVRVPVPEPSEPPPFVCQQIARDHALRLIGAMSTALAEVCTEHGLDWTEVLQAFAPRVAQAIEASKEAILTVEPDADATEGFRSLLARAWADSQ